MATSTAPLAKQRLLTLFAATTALDGVKQTWAAPTDEADWKHENLWLGDVEQTEEWASLGNTRRDEDYTIELSFQTYRDGDDPQAAEARAWAIHVAVSGALRSDITLGGVLNRQAELLETTMQTRPVAPQGWLAKAVCKVHCFARIPA